MIAIALALAPLLSGPSSSNSDSDSEDGGEAPPKTVVVAPRADAPATATATGRIRVTQQDLRRSGGRSLPQAIGRATGVWIQETNLGGGSPFIRGLTGNQILILVDGIRVNDSTTRFGPNQNLNTIDLAIVDSVEIIRGPSSVLYGSDAIGGVVLIWTKNRPAGIRGGETGVGGALSVAGRTDAPGGRVALEVGHATEHSGTLGIGEVHGWGDVRTGAGDTPATGYDGTQWFASQEFAFDEARALRATARIHRDFDVPRTDRVITGFGQMQPSFDRFDFTLQERQTAALTYTDEAAGMPWDSLQARAFVRETDEVRKRRANGSTTERNERDQVQSVGGGLDFQKGLGDHNLLTVGFDVQRDDVDSTRRDIDVTTGVSTPNEGQFAPNASYTSLGVFAQDEILDVAGFDATVGVRWSYFDFEFDDFPSQGGGREDGNFGAVTGSLQVARDVADGVRVTAGIAQGFRAPNLDGLAKDGSFASGTELANADLDPEQSLTEEITIEFVREAWNVAFSAYHTGISDLVGRRLVNAGGPGVGDETYLRDNVGSASIYGAELATRVRLGGETSPWSADADMAYAHGTIFDQTTDPNTGEKPFNNEPVRRIPPLHGTVGLDWRGEAAIFGGLIDWVRCEVQWALRQGLLNPNDETDPRIDPDGNHAWWTLNVDAGGPIGDQGGSTWFVGLHNLLDYEYRVHGSGFDAPGIGLVGGIRLTF